MSGPLLHLAAILAALAAVALAGLEAWHALEHALAGACL